MAEQIPYGVATSLINTLALLASNEIASIYGVEDDIEWLKNTVEDIKTVLSDADHKQHSDQLVRRWISKLKQVLYEADDLLDEIHTQHLLRTRKGKVRDFFSSSNPIAFRRKMAREIRAIREKFNAVAETMTKLNFDPRGVVERKPDKSSNWKETSSKPEENIIGREESEREVVDLLRNTSSNENVSVVAIVGIGGLGKTTLAQLVYNNAKANKVFDKQIWVCVSEDFDVKALVRKILELVTGQAEQNGQQLELLQQKLEENLKGKRYLLVLDDVWNEEREKWLELKKYLTCGAQGSKILVTTRNQRVANKMGVEKPYVLEGLDEDQSWALLKRMAFEKDQKVPQNLESIGRNIAKNCAGVPLAIRVVGSLLQSKSRESDWEDILKEGHFWKLREGNDSIMRILKLSCDSLTFELKQCFAYCSLYPKDWRYEKDELIDLWMAQGFLKNEDEKQCPEDVGEEYVRTLLRKSFLQDVEMDEVGEIKCFKMHDLMHDLSQSIASSYHCMYGGGRKNDERRCCPIHVSFEEYNSGTSQKMMDDPSRLRTFLEINPQHERDPSDLFIFKRLRSLDLFSYRMGCLPKSIGKMIHLRYLNLSFCDELICLPKSISNLVNLQILRLSWCPKLKFCGAIIIKLINLRQLDIGGCKAFEDGMPIGLDRMTNLQRLSYFIVGNSDKKGKKAKLNELKELNLRGKLVIEKLDLVRNVEEESKDANLRAKKNIISLSLKWTRDSDMKNSDAMQLLENLEPHQNLKVLTVFGYSGVRFSDWLLSCRNLVKLQFHLLNKCQYLELSEGLIYLKTLHIIGMPELEYIYCKGYSSSNDFFPSLEELIIEWCGSLKGWLREANDQNTGDSKWHPSLPPFSCLSSLEIRDCPNLCGMPTFPNLVSHLDLTASSTKPLLDTLNMSTIQPSTSYHMHVSLSMLKSLTLDSMDIGTLPEKWMQNLSSLKCLCIMSSPSLEKLFHHMLNLSATLEEFQISNMDSWKGDEDYDIQWQHLQCLHSLQTIRFTFCKQLKALPSWICHLHSLQLIRILSCPNLESLPERMRDLTNLQTLRMEDVPLVEERCKRGIGADWKKIEHIPNIQIGWDWIKSS